MLESGALNIVKVRWNPCIVMYSISNFICQYSTNLSVETHILLLSSRRNIQWDRLRNMQCLHPNPPRRVLRVRVPLRVHLLVISFMQVPPTLLHGGPLNSHKLYRHNLCSGSDQEVRSSKICCLSKSHMCVTVVAATFMILVSDLCSWTCSLY